MNPAHLLAEPAPASAIAIIRGRQLDLSALVDPRLFDATHRADLRRQIDTAQPFRHVVVDGWFDPVLLQLVHEEFDLHGRAHWKTIADDQQQFRRSTRPDALGPASQLYFSIVNAGWFVSMLAEITGLEELMVDAELYGGGLHETRDAGKFGVHRDFDRHVRHGVENRMVFITYLNAHWDPAWGAALELWDAEMQRCVRSITPELGRSILLLHGPSSFHGHPLPMTAPPGQTRRSVASYYYQNPLAVEQRIKRVTSVFLIAHKSRSLRKWMVRLLPPIVFDAIKKIVSR